MSFPMDPCPSWGEFLERLLASGVTVETSDAEIRNQKGERVILRYLERLVDGEDEARYVPLPDMDEDEIAQPNTIRFYCDRLGFDTDADFGYRWLPE